MTLEDATIKDCAKNVFRNNIFLVAMDSTITAFGVFQTTLNICTDASEGKKKNTQKNNMRY